MVSNRVYKEHKLMSLSLQCSIAILDDQYFFIIFAQFRIQMVLYEFV